MAPTTPVTMTKTAANAGMPPTCALDSIARGVVIDLANMVICIARGASSANKVSHAVKGASMPPKAILAINRQP